MKTYNVQSIADHKTKQLLMELNNITGYIRPTEKESVSAEWT